MRASLLLSVALCGALSPAARQSLSDRRGHVVLRAEPKWESGVNELIERVESVKVAAARLGGAPKKQMKNKSKSVFVDFVVKPKSRMRQVGGLVAAVSAAPVGFALHSSDLAQWEFNTDQLSLMGALFGLVFRYAVLSHTQPRRTPVSSTHQSTERKTEELWRAAAAAGAKRREPAAAPGRREAPG